MAAYHRVFGGSLIVCSVYELVLFCIAVSCIKGEVIYFQGSNSIKIVLPPFCKGVCSERKEFALLGSKFFLFRVDPFSEGAWCAKGSHKSCLPWEKYRNINQVYPVPLLPYPGHW